MLAQLVPERTNTRTAMHLLYLLCVSVSHPFDQRAHRRVSE